MAPGAPVGGEGIRRFVALAFGRQELPGVGEPFGRHERNVRTDEGLLRLGVGQRCRRGRRQSRLPDRNAAASDKHRDRYQAAEDSNA